MTTHGDPKERLMSEPQPETSTASGQRIARIVHASAEVIYRAIVEPDLLVRWQAPGEMTARVKPSADDAGYEMTLRYPDTDVDAVGKSGEREDRYTARYLAREPGRRVVEAITFETDDPAFAGTMIYTVTLEEASEGTLVTMAYSNLPSGIRPEDNELGTRLSLANLAALVEGGVLMDTTTGR